MTKEAFTEWDTKYKNDLPDSSFAYISPGGEKDEEGKTKPRSLRHLPYKDKDGKPDLPHVRNALARLEHTDIPEDKKPGIKSKLEKILEKSKASEKGVVGMFPLEFKEGDAGESGGSIPATIHLIPVGAWEHDCYGDIVITATDVKEFAQNFNNKIRNGVFITAGHEGFSELPAVGWITKVEARGDGLWGEVDWNELGKEALEDKQFKFFSPEFFPTYEDPQSHEVYHNVLTGGALTKSPYFKELEALVMSDKIIKNNFKETTMDMASILGKKKADLNQEEKDYLKKNKSKLSDAQMKEYKDIVGDKEEENEEEKKKASEKEEKEKKEASEKEEEKKKREASERGGANVQISASEYAALTKAADEGKQAFAELQKTKLSDAVKGMTFSASNKAGRFLPKSETDLRAFMEKLNDGQRKAFSELVAQIPATGVKELFEEKGIGTKAAEGTAQAELDAKVNLKMSEAKLTYSEALKSVLAENAELAQRYDEELPPAHRG